MLEIKLTKIHKTSELSPNYFTPIY